MAYKLTTVEEAKSWEKAKKENERLEFKEARSGYSHSELEKYCVAIANEGGGRLILGVTDELPRKVVGSSAFQNREKIAKQLYDGLHFRVDVEEFPHPDGRVVVFHIPSRPKGHAYHIQGSAWMRVGNSLERMTPEKLSEIVAEAPLRHQSSIRSIILGIALVMAFLLYLLIRSDFVLDLLRPYDTGARLRPPWDGRQPEIRFPPTIFPVPTSTKHKAETEPRPLVAQVPVQISSGNLKERAIELSDEIMSGLYRFGWPNPPNTDTAQQKSDWLNKRKRAFHFLYLQQVVDLRNEFAELHIRDRDLDHDLEQANIGAHDTVAPSLNMPTHNQLQILTIVDIAGRLKVMAAETR
jgi:hypothetical protein